MSLQMQTLIKFQQEIPVVDTFRKTIVKSKMNNKSVLKITYQKVKSFFWNLSTLHWCDEFKDIKIDLIEFDYKKNKL